MNGLLLIGAPGAGKSTLMRAALQGSRVTNVHAKPFARVVYNDGVATQLGRTGGMFPGTDQLSMSVAPKVADWLAERWVVNVVAEGDRLACATFIDAMVRYCDTFTLVLLDTLPELAAERRAMRAEAMGGTTQSDAWVRGRATKVVNLVDKYSDHLAVIGPGLAPSQQVTALRSLPGMTWVV